MSIWTRIIKAIEALAKGQSLSDVFDKLKTPPERSIAFTIAVIAVSYTHLTLPTTPYV